MTGECTDDYCQNGGTCNEGGTDSVTTCTCSDKWFGETCTVRKYCHLSWDQLLTL